MPTHIIYYKVTGRPKKETEKLTCDSALPLKSSYFEVITYMAGKMAQNTVLIVFNYVFEGINRVCFNDFAVKGMTEFWSLKKYRKLFGVCSTVE